MPTENEIKYAIKIESEMSIYDWYDYKIQISQSYLAFTKGLSVRLRKSVSEDKDVEYVLCFKQKANNRIIEVEKSLDQRDFDDLWNISINKLVKTRYVIKDGENKWEIDYFMDGERTYFALAEVEMPEGQEEPDRINAFVMEHLLYCVPLTDDRFSSKRLSDVRHAGRVYKKLVSGVKAK